MIYLNELVLDAVLGTDSIGDVLTITDIELPGRVENLLTNVTAII